MRKDAIAEWILQLVTTRERAAATVGDLLEKDASFWWSVLRTSAALLWQGIAEEPGRMWWLGCRAVLMSGGLSILCFAGVLAVGIGYLVATSRVGLGDVSGGIGWAPAAARWWIVALLLLVRLQVGRWVGKRARGREFSACLTTAVVYLVATAALNLLVTVGTGQKPGRGLLTGGETALLDQIPLFLGAYSIRRRATVDPHA